MEVNEQNAGSRVISWQETYYEDKDLDCGTEIGRRREDVFGLPLAFVQISNYEKLLEHLNTHLGTLFDEYEYDDVSCEKLPSMIAAIHSFIEEKKYRIRNSNEIIKHCYRLNPDRTPLYYASATVGEFVNLLDQLCDFLKEAFDKKKSIVVAL